MIPGKIANATRKLGAPADWDRWRGTCDPLSIQDIPTSQGPAMQSVWEPTPEELDRLNKGASVTLLVLGVVHPPVMLSVGAAPDEHASADG